jgi:hypothetical protein
LIFIDTPSRSPFGTLSTGSPLRSLCRKSNQQLFCHFESFDELRINSAINLGVPALANSRFLGERLEMTL